jgi:hypothetical protein
MQRLLQRPQGFSSLCCLDQDQAAWIEAEGVQAAAIGTAVMAQSIGRHDEEDRVSAHHASKQGHNEAEGGGGGAFIGHDLMQSATGKAALRQATIDGGKAKGKGLYPRKPFHSGQ